MKTSSSLTAISLAFATSAFATPTHHEPTLANPLKTVELQQRHELETRQAELIPLAVGVWLSIAGETVAENFVGWIADAMNAAFSHDPAPWKAGSGKCIIKYSTHGGAECKSSIDAKGVKTSHPQKNWNVCPWINPKHTDPPVQYFTDPGVGDYSVQFTATDKVAWKGIAKTHKCGMQGLCNPRITFFRKKHSIILDTWLSTGDPTEGQYAGDFGGLCGNGPIKDQFRSNGNEMGFDCGIPCEGATDLPSTRGG